MEEGLLSLKWNNHRSTFTHVLSSLRQKELHTDATLGCEGEFFPVHKLILSMCSDYFNEAFKRTSCKSPVVMLLGIKSQELVKLLDYMYMGEVDVRQDELASLIKAAEALEIKGLAVPDEEPESSKPKTTERQPGADASPPPKRQKTSSGNFSSPNAICKQTLSNITEQVSSMETQSSIFPVETIKLEHENKDDTVNDDRNYTNYEMNVLKKEENYSEKQEHDNSNDESSPMQDNTEWIDMDSNSAQENSSSNQLGVMHHMKSARLKRTQIYLSSHDIYHTPLDRMNNLSKRLDMHSGERQYLCDYCSYQARDKHHLIEHVRTHTGEKPFGCPHCEYRSNRLREVKAHLRRKHGMIPEML